MAAPTPTNSSLRFNDGDEQHVKRLRSLLEESMVDSRATRQRTDNSFAPNHFVSLGSSDARWAPAVLGATMPPTLPPFSPTLGAASASLPMMSAFPYLPVCQQPGYALGTTGYSHGRGYAQGTQPWYAQGTQPYNQSPFVDQSQGKPSDLVSFLLAHNQHNPTAQIRTEPQPTARLEHIYPLNAQDQDLQVTLQRLMLEEEQKMRLRQRVLTLEAPALPSSHDTRSFLHVQGNSQGGPYSQRESFQSPHDSNGHMGPSLVQQQVHMHRPRVDGRLVNASNSSDGMPFTLQGEPRLTREAATPRYTKEHAKALVSSSPGPDETSVSVMPPTTLAHPTDHLLLSSHQVFLRQQIEVFEATEYDTISHTRGRNTRISIGQVGIRCRFCAHATGKKQKGSVYFPASTMGLYQAAQNMSAMHLQCGACTHMPDAAKTQFAELIPSKTTGSLRGRSYWSTMAKSLGLVDTDQGIRYCSTAKGKVDLTRI